MHGSGWKTAPMSYTALVTGASAGLGEEIARQLAALRVNLVLVARTERRLDAIAMQLRRSHGVSVEVLAADLSESSGLERVAARLADDDTPVDILVNNAGFGVLAPFERSDVEEERRLHEVLSWAPLRLSHAAIPGMLARGRGWILNVASVAAFTPTGSYGAAKAAVVSLSRSLHARYADSGVHVTALCPGLLQTEFHERMGPHLPALSRLAFADTRRVAREGLRAVYRGSPVVSADWRYRVARPLTWILPDRLLERISAAGDHAPLAR